MHAVCVLDLNTPHRGVLERFGGVDGDMWAFHSAMAAWDNELSRLIEARLPKLDSDLSQRSKEERDTAMSLSQFSFKLYYEIKALVAAVQPHDQRVTDALSIYRYPSVTPRPCGFSCCAHGCKTHDSLPFSHTRTSTPCAAQC